MNIEEKFNKDTLWLISELKQEELTNAYSEYKIEFLINQKSDSEPDIRSQHRILKMLSDKKAITLSPFYHRNISALNYALEMQGATPIGFYIKILQPQFDNLCEEITKQKAPSVKKFTIEKQNPAMGQGTDKYFVSLNPKGVFLNNTFLLSSPNFNGENANFIEYVINTPDKKLSKTDFEKNNGSKPKKNFSQILTDLGFKGEIRKIFFDVSKTAVQFRNYVSESKLQDLGIDSKKLAEELSTLEGN
jgi:hypothetical protein